MQIIKETLYMARQAAAGIRRHIAYAAVSIITMSICILMFGILCAVWLNVDGMMKVLEERLTISVFLADSIDDVGIQEIENKIKDSGNAASVEWISPDAAWEEYKKEYFDGKEELAEGFDDGENPLEQSGHFDIRIANAAKQRDLVNYIAEIDGVRQVNQSEQAAVLFTDMNKAVAMAAAFFVVVLALISAFFIYCAISEEISSRKNEIAIMHMLGASKWFILCPFFMEGLIIGTIGTAVPIFAFRMLYDSAMEGIGRKFAFMEEAIGLVSVGDVFSMMIPAALCMGVFMGPVSSIVAAHRKIKVKKSKNI